MNKILNALIFTIMFTVVSYIADIILINRWQKQHTTTHTYIIMSIVAFVVYLTLSYIINY